MTEIQKSAIFSDDGIYRYQLLRIWNPNVRPVMFIGMNPSTADATQDDPTIRRCIRFAHDWGYGGLLMGNLFAYRATDPKLLPSNDPMPDGESYWNKEVQAFVRVNDEHIRIMSKRAGIIIAAWGSIKMPKGWEYQPKRIYEIVGNMHVLGFTKSGHPRHPLYIKASVYPIPMETM